MYEFDALLAEKLERAGLSDKEASVYTALLGTKGAFPSRIAQITKLNRTTIYHILDSLMVKGLVTELEKRSKLFYQAEHPRNVERLAQNRIVQAKRNLEYAQGLLPKLEGLFARADNKPIVKFFEGKEGVLRVYEDHIATDKPYEMLGWSNTANLMKFLPQSFIDSYIKKKEKIGITTRGIFPDTETDVEYNKRIYKGVSEKTQVKHKNIPQKDFPYNSEITVYGDNKVSIINFNEPQPAGTIIEDKTIHGMMRMIFELSWAGASVEPIKK
ncbi:hypothetical protein CL654_00245 [bacterium]|nr:hypothetical protein [bacterium]